MRKIRENSKKHYSDIAEEGFGQKIKYRIFSAKEALGEYYSNKRELDLKMEDMRVDSIDFFRGILVILSLFLINQGLENSINPSHQVSKWNGLNFADLILPMFLMVMGMSIVFFVKKYYEDGKTMGEIMKKIFVRFLIYLVIGVLFSMMYFKAKYVRLTGPIQVIAISYLISASIYIGLLRLKVKNNALTYFFICMAISLSLMFTALGFSNGFDDGTKSIFTIVDKRLISNFTLNYSGIIADPEGILVSFSSISATLFGLSIGCILNKKKVNKRYKRYRRVSRISESGYTRENIIHDIKSWINPRSIKSLLSNYYRLNNEAKKVVNLILLSIGIYIVSHIVGIWIPLNRNVFSVSFVLRVASYVYFIMAVLYIVCDILTLRFGTILIRRIGMNSLFIIFTTTLVYKIFNLIKIKSIYTNSWINFNNWFTTDFILPITGIDTASACYAAVVTLIWVLISNLLEKYDIKIGL